MLSWVGKGKKIEDILQGVHQSIAARSIGLLRRVGVEEEVTFTGGVARNIGMIEALQKGLGTKLNVSDDSHFMGALGAALFALDHVLAGRLPACHWEAIMIYTAGIDVGSTYTKVVIVNEELRNPRLRL